MYNQLRRNRDAQTSLLSIFTLRNNGQAFPPVIFVSSYGLAVNVGKLMLRIIQYLF